VPDGYPDWFPCPVSPVLSIIDEAGTATLFSESELPADYRSVFGYAIAAVYANPTVRGSLLVVLHTLEPGFEGSDGRFRVVSGSVE